MSDTFRPRTLLARQTLLTLAAPLTVVIGLTTLLGYLFIHQTLRAEAVERLQQYVAERTTREGSIFLLAQDNHTVLGKALEKRLRVPAGEEVDARFDRLFVRLPDGTVRNRPELFDGTQQVGVFIPRGVPMDAGLRRRVLTAHDVLDQYGPAFGVRFTNTFITLTDGVLLMYWPEVPAYVQGLAPDTRATDRLYFRATQPGNNPGRRPVWSRTYKDEVTHAWMTSVTTPLDVEGQHAAAITHDVLIADLMGRTINNHLPGSYNILLREDGELIAHPRLQENAVTERLEVEPGSRAHLAEIIARVGTRRDGPAVLELPERDEYLAVARMQGTGWNFITVLPRAVVARPAVQVARAILVLGVLALLVELGFINWALRRRLTHPLHALTRATDRVAAGDFQVELDTRREDELGQLARAFQLMTTRLRHRDEELRAANEGLEQRVEERTRELQEVHRQLVQTARRTGMAEIATNVLHNVGNVLNSVYTSSQLARERVTEMRVDHVGRVSRLLHERRGDLATFLTQDDRGRHLTPFLDKLGQNLLEERQEVVTLLDDVGRYTEHIGEIVKVQQDYARPSRMDEPVQLSGLVEDALRINATGLSRHQVRVEREMDALPPILTDKHKTLMILVNLISNARHALDEMPLDERRLHVKVERATNGFIHIALNDNGVGIAPELLTRIFQFGFTTREEGHGFGLHSSALAARELGGSLKVHSDGPGRGATFTLALPDHPVQERT